MSERILYQMIRDDTLEGRDWVEIIAESYMLQAGKSLSSIRVLVKLDGGRIGEQVWLKGESRYWKIQKTGFWY